MKQLMIDTMSAMMPFMRPLSYIAIALIAIGLLLALVSRMGGRPSRFARWCGSFVVLAGVFLLACELAGRFLGFEPTILYAAPFDREMYVNQWPFWAVGGMLFVVGLIVKGIAGRATD